MCSTDVALGSDTDFSLFDYNPEVIRIADEIDPGQMNVSYM